MLSYKTSQIDHNLILVIILVLFQVISDNLNTTEHIHTREQVLLRRISQSLESALEGDERENVINQRKITLLVDRYRFETPDTDRRWDSNNDRIAGTAVVFGVLVDLAQELTRLGVTVGDVSGVDVGRLVSGSVHQLSRFKSSDRQASKGEDT